LNDNDEESPWLEAGGVNDNDEGEAAPESGVERSAGVQAAITAPVTISNGQRARGMGSLLCLQGSPTTRGTRIG
jgi:hypothetical protein